MNCPTCGKQLDQGTRFCPDDGTPLTDTAVASSPTQIPQRNETRTVRLDLPVTVGNRYKLVELRGGGGMAKVYRGIDQTLEREVAVKLINPELRSEPEFDARFQREAKIAGQLSDPHIVSVHDFGIDPKYGPYLVMEFLKGQSLRERLVSHGVLPLKAALQLGAQMLLALIHAHEKGIVHRDIKPDNVFLLNQSGVRLHVRILDFGIARIYREDQPAREPITVPGAVMGTPRYMSPEQLGGQPVDLHTDIYSAALVIFESLTGQLPYAGGKKLTQLSLEATPSLQDLIEHCLRPDPNDRPKSAVEVYLRLQELGKASGVLLLPPGAMDRLMESRNKGQGERTLPYRPGSGTKLPRNKLLLGGLALVVVVVLAVIALATFFKKTGREASPAKESLLNIEIGMTRDEMIAKIGSAPDKKIVGDPWKMIKDKERPELLGHVLQPDDFGDEDKRAGLETLIWSKRKITVVLRGDEVVGLVTRSRDASLRKYHIGIDAGKILDVMSEESVNSTPFSLSESGGASKKKGMAYRYDARGIGFEAESDYATAFALYPATE